MLDAVRFAGGWIYDRVMAGWDVTVLLARSTDERPLDILGVETGIWNRCWRSGKTGPTRRPSRSPPTCSPATNGCASGVLGALEQGLTEVTLWGERLPAELDDSVGPVAHHLSAAARAFKSQALTGRRRTSAPSARYRDIPLRCDGDAVGALRGPHSGVAEVDQDLADGAAPSATCRSARAVSASG